jgi:GGDEF domain-containing protein
MEITSIKKYLTPGKAKPTDYARCLQLLLQGLSLHTIEGDPDDMALFQQDLNSVAGALTEESSAEELLLGVGSVIHAFDEFTRSTNKFTRARTHEFHAMLAMATETISFLGSSSEAELKQLHTFEKKLHDAATIEDVRGLRAKLDECLKDIRNESLRVKEHSQTKIAAFKAGIELAAGQVSPKKLRGLDTATGLAGHAAAEEAVASRISDGEPFAVTLFIVDRLRILNGRFGRAISDQVLMLVAQHLGQTLPGDSSLFRWSGSAFLAILPAGVTGNAAKKQMQHVVATRLEKSIETGGRSLLLPIALSFMLQQISPSDSAENVFRGLDKMVAASAGDDPE